MHFNTLKVYLMKKAKLIANFFLSIKQSLAKPLDYQRVFNIRRLEPANYQPLFGTRCSSSLPQMLP